MTPPLIGLSAGLILTTAALAREDNEALKAPDVGQSYRVPYRTTDTNHALVRVRINGKGPFNLLVDTGAPLFYISTDTARKIGLEPSQGFYTPVKRLDFEGGPFLTNLKARVEDPFQLVGMNALGLPGTSIDGILGFAILARFRLELDPTSDRMTWTRLDFEPKDLPIPEDAKERVAPPEVQAMNLLGPLMKFASIFIGKKPETRLRPRGSLGIELGTLDGPARVSAVLEGSPAADAGVRVGDELTRIDGRAVSDGRSAIEAIAQIEPGAELKLIVKRGDATEELRLIAGEGF
jgi:hypothetical protein